MSNVLVVLNCFSRPANIQKVTKAWREQSIPSIVILVNNGGLHPDAIEDKSHSHDIWTWGVNSGCPSHFYPALSYTPFEFPYTIFADDDLIPGKSAIEVLLNHAQLLEDKFSTIGQIGRNFLLHNHSGQRYSGRNSATRHSTMAVKTHLTCRAHMIRTEYLPHILSFRNQLSLHSREGNRLAQIHDDFLMCMGIQKTTEYPSFLTRIDTSTDSALIAQDLDDNKAVWRKPGHWEDRNTMVDLSLELGWKPIH